MSAVDGTGSAAPASVLLERAAEVSSIESACQRARDGDGRVVVLAGRAGIGKSSLLVQPDLEATRPDGRSMLTRPVDHRRPSVPV